MNIEPIWKEFYAPLKGFVAKRVNNHAAVDDIVQNVFINIANHISEVKDSQKIFFLHQAHDQTVARYIQRGH